jgi:hypothetical protein
MSGYRKERISIETVGMMDEVEEYVQIDTCALPIEATMILPGGEPGSGCRSRQQE